MKKTVSKILAVLLSVAVVAVMFAGCTKTVTVECTCDCCAGAGGASGDSSFKPVDTFKANGKSDADCSSKPSSKEDIIALYTAVANATKAAPNQKYQEVQEGAKIAVKTLAFDKSGKALSATMMSVVTKLIDSFSPKPITKNITVSGGKVTEETCEREGKSVDADDVGAAVKDLLPIANSEAMCTLTADEVSEATCEEDGNFWKITFTLAEDQFSFVDNKNTPETMASHAMFTLRAQDLITNFGGAAAITGADLQYKPTLVAYVDPNSGYLAALATYLDIYGHVTGRVDTMNIGGINGDLDKTTYYSSYYWESIG